MSLTDYETLVDNFVRDDDGKISTTQRDDAIADAVTKYSDDKPRVVVEDVTADGTEYLDLPAAWEQDFSEVLSLEYPIGSSPLSYIDEFSLYQLPAEFKIKLPSSVTSGNDVRASFTIMHTLTGVTDTIPSKHKEAVASYAASLLCTQLANLYSGDEDSTLQADNVNHGSKASRFSKRAKELRESYHDLLGIDKKRTKAASAVHNLDRKDSQGNTRLYHKGKY